MVSVSMPTGSGNSNFFWKSGNGTTSPYSQTGEADPATVTITSTSTTYVPQTGWIDASGYNQIAIVPNVGTAAGTNGYFKIQWSADGTTALGEDNYDASGVVSGSEYLASTVSFVMAFASGTTGQKLSSLYCTAKKMRYFRILQKSDATNTVTATYTYQMS